jgi:hypothetical protein
VQLVVVSIAIVAVGSGKLISCFVAQSGVFYFLLSSQLIVGGCAFAFTCFCVLFR